MRMQSSRRPGEMETISGSLGVLLVLCPLLARALYVHDDSPAAGYVGDYHRKMPAHKMYYISNTNLKNMKLVNERAVDSYFKILRATPQAYSAAGRDRSSPLDRRAITVTEPPPPPRHRHSAENPAYVPRNDPHGDNEKTTPGLNQSTKHEGEELFKPSRNEYFRRHSVYEKHAVVSKGTRGNRRPHRAQNFHQKMYLSQPVRDNILHKADANGDRSGRPARLLVDTSQTDVRSAKEYRKRNTIGKDSVFAKDTSSQRVDEQSDNRLDSPGYMRVGADGQHAESGAGAGHALFYRLGGELEAPPLDARAALEEAADGAYYRGSASSYVHLNIGRKAAPVL